MKVYVAYAIVPNCESLHGTADIVPSVHKSVDAAWAHTDSVWDIIEYDLINVPKHIGETAQLEYCGKILQLDDDFEPHPVVNVMMRSESGESMEFAMMSD